MNLAWLAAVLQPYDVAPHPNFADDDYDSGGTARLAAAVLGDPWRRHRVATLLGEIDDKDLLTLAEQCLLTETMAVSVPTLAGRLSGSRPRDLAQAAALALITCSAAAELDDYSTCFRVLDAQLRWTTEIHLADDALLRAALLQQKALRLRDAGRPHLPTTLEAGEALRELKAERCSSFPTSPGVSWSSRTTVEQIRESLLAAAASLIPIEATDAATAAGLPTWQERVRGPVPSITVRTARNRAEAYADYLEQVFARQFRTGAQAIGERVRPELFYSVLALELTGHGSVYAARKELALLRLVQTGADLTEMADALRSLRQAAAKNELDLALSRLRAAGPLSVLSQDARQILRKRTAPELLRTVELRVLRMAADLLAPAEAALGLDAVRATLAAGGPPDLPGQSELLVLRKEIAWVTAAALGNACGATGQVAAFLLEEAADERQGDQLLDRALRRAAAEIEWAEVPQEVKNSWLELLRVRNASLPGTAEVVFARLNGSSPTPVSSAPMDVLIHRVNRAISDGSIDSALTREGIPLIRERLTKIRADAAVGAYSLGGVSAAEIAVALVTVVGVEELWPELTDFLLDSAVDREDRTRAFERLARADVPLPGGVKDRFRDQAQDLLFATSAQLFQSPLIPYPAALRFLGAHKLMDDTDIYDAIAILAGKGDAEGRREAAATLAMLAATAPHGGFLALALPLAHDDDVEVRANAARALALLSQRDEALAAVARRSLMELLREDGLLVPIQVLRALADLPAALPEEVRHQIEELASQHPARSVRVEAGRLLRLPRGDRATEGT